MHHFVTKLTTFLLILLPGVAWAQTDVSGSIAANTTWAAADGPFTVTSDVTVQDGATLTIEAGVTVQFNTDRSLVVQGILIADGVTFTSSEDAPAPGDWRQIRMSDGADIDLSNCTIQYAGRSSRYPLEVGGFVAGSGSGTAVVDNCTISDAPRGVIVHETLTATGLNLSNLTETGLYVANASAQATVTGSDISTDGTGLHAQGTLDVTGTTVAADLGLELEGTAAVTLTDVTINAQSWPIRYDGMAALSFAGANTITSASTNGILLTLSGTPNTTGAYTLDTAPIPYYFERDFTVQATDTLTVATDNVLKFQGGHLYVRGTLKAIADEGETIYFTSYRNDNLGGDTNGDGSSTSPDIGNWGGIHFYDESDDSSELRRVDISYADRGIETQDAAPTIEENNFRLSRHGAWIQGTSSPTFSENTIGTSDVTPIALSLEASPVFSNNTFSFENNQFDAIGLIGGALTADGTLIQRDVTNIPNVTYYLLGDVTVPNGLTLTIEEGIVIKADGSKAIFVDGTLVADATEGNEIIFTSVRDDNYGNPNDTNRDGNTTTPGTSDWDGLYFGPTSTASVIDHAVIQYGRHDQYHSYNSQSYYFNAAIGILGSSPSITNTLIKDVFIGIGMALDAEPTITNVAFANTESVPVELSIASDPTFSGNTMTNVSLQALGLRSETLGLDGTIRKLTFAGFENITYIMRGDITVASGANVTVEPGIVIKPEGGADIFVDGGFKADASEGSEIIFTSFKDDNRGNPGDTNGDGNASAPGAGDWGTIQFRGTSDDAFSLLDNVVLRYGQAGAIFTDAGTPVDSVLVTDARYWGLVMTGSAAPQISNTTIQNSANDPILMSILSDPQFAGMAFVANGSQGLALLEGTRVGCSFSSCPLRGYFSNNNTLSSDATLVKRNVAGIENIAYVLGYRMTVGSSAVFTIDPGVVIKGGSSGRLHVDGALVAQGTEAEPVIFTAYADDSAGGDTNNDGNNSQPGRGAWGGLEFRASSLEAQNVLDRVNVRYAQGEPIQFRNAYALVENSTIEQTNGSAVGIYGDADPLIRNNQFLNISETPVYMSLFSTPTFENNTTANVGYMGIALVPETYSTTATVPMRDFGGYENITYILANARYTINNGTVLTIPAGVVFKTSSGRYSSGGYFQVEGAIRVEGTAEAPVIFTEVDDDAYGNPADTRLDGEVWDSYNLNGAWFTFNATSDDANTLIENAVLRHRDYGLTMTSAAPTVRSTRFENLEWGLELKGVSKPVLESNTFDDLRYAPLLISLVSYPAVTTGNTISGSTYEAIGVISETLVQDVTLPRRTFAGREGIPYYFTSTYTIGTGATLTVAPGNVLKFGGGSLNVKKGLIAEGTADPDSVIVFTHINDDFYGGDTNADSSASQPGTWQGILYEDEALDNLSRLDHVVVRHAGNSNRGGVTAESSSPTITNSVLRDNSIGLLATGAANPVVTNSDIYGNSQHGVRNDGTFVLDATGNWWGADTGPTHATNPDGTGDAVSDNVDFGAFSGAGAANPILGDASLNGSVSSLDAAKILRHVVGTETLTSAALGVADVSGNGDVTSMDASYVLQYVIGLIPAFPAEALLNVKPGQAPLETPLHAAEVNATLGFGDVAAEGKALMLPIRLDDLANVFAVQLTLRYDPATVSLTDVTKGSLTDDRSFVWEEAEPGVLRLALASAEALPASGKLATLAFSASGAAPELTVDAFVANETDLTPHVTSIDLVEMPEAFALDQNYPNPFNPSTTIAFSVPDAGTAVRVGVYNVLGQRVRLLVDGTYAPGRYEVVWDGRDAAGQAVSSGVYFYRMDAGDFHATKSLMLVK